MAVNLKMERKHVDNKLYNFELFIIVNMFYRIQYVSMRKLAFIAYGI